MEYSECQKYIISEYQNGYESGLFIGHVEGMVITFIVIMTIAILLWALKQPDECVLDDEEL